MTTMHVSNGGTSLGYNTTGPTGTWSTSTMSSSFTFRRSNGTYWLAVHGSSTAVGKSTDGVNYTTVGNLPVSSSWCLVWSPELSLWVTSSTNGTIATSPDGTTWTTRTPSTSGQFFQGCAWSPTLGLFVLCSRTSAVFMTSPDGINWTSRTSANGVFAGTWCACVWTGEAFVAVNQSGATSLRSTDGITWTSISVGAACWNVTHNGNGVLVASVDNSSTCRYSNDHGVTWSSKSLPASRRWGAGGLCYDGTYFVMCAYGANAITYSADGSTWLSGTNLPFSPNIGAGSALASDWVFVSGTTYTQTCSATVATTATRSVLQSYTTQQTCSTTSTSTATISTSIILPPKSFITSQYNGVEGRISTDDGATWTSYNYSTSSIYFKRWNGLYWIGGSSTTAITVKSTDGINWTSTTISGASTIGGVAWSPELSLWVTSWTNGTIFTSPDGTTWTSRTPANAGQNWNSVAWSPTLGKFVITTNSGSYFNYSSDGITWYSSGAAEGIPSGFLCPSLCWTGEAFIAPNQATSTVLLRSTDGVNWTSITVPSGQYWFAATNGTGTIVAAIENSSNCLVSTDHGLTWSTVALGLSARWGAGGVAYNGTYFILAAYDTTSWRRSTDGLTWTTITGPYNFTQLDSAWVPEYPSTGIIYNQLAEAVVSTVSTIVSSSTKVLSLIASAITSSLKASNSYVTKASTVTSPTLKLMNTSMTKSYSASTVPAILKQQQSTKTVNVTSTSTTLASLLKLVTALANVNVTTTIQKAGSFIKGLTVDHTINTSKSVLLNRAASTASVSTWKQTTNLLRNIAVNTSTLMSRAIESTFTAISNVTLIGDIIPLALHYYQVCETAVITTATKTVDVTMTIASGLVNVTSTILKALSATYSTASASVSTKVVDVLSTMSSAYTTSTALMSRTASSIKNAIASTTSTIQKAVDTIKSVIASTIASLDFTNAFLITASALANTVATITKQASKIRNAIASTTISLNKFVGRTIGATANAYASVNKLVSIAYGALVDTLSRFTETYQSLTGHVLALYVSIKDTIFYRTAVPITTFSTVAVDLEVPHTTLYIEPVEHTTLII